MQPVLERLARRVIAGLMLVLPAGTLVAQQVTAATRPLSTADIQGVEEHPLVEPLERRALARVSARAE